MLQFPIITLINDVGIALFPKDTDWIFSRLAMKTLLKCDFLFGFVCVALAFLLDNIFL